MKKKIFAELREKRTAAEEKIGDIYAKAANRKFTEDEEMEVLNLKREVDLCETKMSGINLEMQNANAMTNHRRETINRTFREELESSLKTQSQRSILLNAGKEMNGSTDNTTGNIAASGAISLTIHDVIPTLNEGLGLAKGVSIVTGVTGNEVWPVSINDVEFDEVGEVEALSEQNLDFASITPTPKRSGLTINISNTAIDNAAFDLLGFVQSKITLATRKYLAKKLYSQAAWTGVKGPFSGLTEAGTITLDGDAYKSILMAVAKFTDKGFDASSVCLVVDAVTEAELKATPKADGQGGFIIENGKLAGYDYVVSHFINTKLSSTNLVATEDRFIGIGYFEWLAVQQHGEVRLTIDPLTQAKNNVTAITLNTAWSITDLSEKINGGSGKTQAFALYKVDGISKLSSPAGTAVPVSSTAAKK